MTQVIFNVVWSTPTPRGHTQRNEDISIVSKIIITNWLKQIKTPSLVYRNCGWITITNSSVKFLQLVLRAPLNLCCEIPSTWIDLQHMNALQGFRSFFLPKNGWLVPLPKHEKISTLNQDVSIFKAWLRLNQDSIFNKLLIVLNVSDCNWLHIHEW